MRDHDPWRESSLALRADLLWASVLLWVLRFGREQQLLPSTHWFFYDRYHALAAHCRRQGQIRRAARLERRADEHLRAAGGDPDEPIAAAMALPRRRRTFRVKADGRVVRLVRRKPDSTYSG